MFKLKIKNNKKIQRESPGAPVVDNIFDVEHHDTVELNTESIDDFSKLKEADIEQYHIYAQNMLKNQKFNDVIKQYVLKILNNEYSLEVQKSKIYLLHIYLDAELTILLSKLIKISDTGQTSFPSKFNCNFKGKDDSVEDSCRNLHFRKKNFLDIKIKELEALTIADQIQDGIYGLFTASIVKSCVDSDNMRYDSIVSSSCTKLLEETGEKIYLVLKNEGLTFYYITQSKLNFLFSHIDISDKHSDIPNEKSYDFSSDRHQFIRALVYPVFDDHYNYYTGKLRITSGKLYEILTLFIRFRVEYIESLIASNDSYTTVNAQQDLLAFKVFNYPPRVNNNYYYRYHNDSSSGRKINLLEKLNGEFFNDELNNLPSDNLKSLPKITETVKQKFSGLIVLDSEIQSILELEKVQSKILSTKLQESSQGSSQELPRSTSQGSPQGSSSPGSSPGSSQGSSQGSSSPRSTSPETSPETSDNYLPTISLSDLLYRLSTEKDDHLVLGPDGLNIFLKAVSEQYPGGTHVWIL